MGSLSVMAVRQSILIRSRWPFAMPHGIIRWSTIYTKGTLQKFTGRIVRNKRRAAHQKNESMELEFRTVILLRGAYNAGRRIGGSPEVESRTSGADISMQRAGWKCSLSLVLVLGFILLTVVPLFAQQTPATDAAPSSTFPLIQAAFLTTPDPATSVHEKLAQLDKHAKAAKSSADNACMLVSAALVLMMTGPGLALFYGGLLRRQKNPAYMTPRFSL